MNTDAKPTFEQRLKQIDSLIGETIGLITLAQMAANELDKEGTHFELQAGLTAALAAALERAQKIGGLAFPEGHEPV
jgi:hypothetical protein